MLRVPSTQQRDQDKTKEICDSAKLLILETVFTWKHQQADMAQPTILCMTLAFQSPPLTVITMAATSLLEETNLKRQ